jgi:hypothetical protein
MRRGKEVGNALDKEHEGRIAEIARAVRNGSEVEVSDIVSSAPVVRAFELPKLILPSYDRQKILLAYPFSREIYVPICPNCVTDSDVADLKVFLRHRAIVPVLIAPYGDYSDAIAKAIMPMPHLSVHEFSFLRFIRLMSMSKKGVCQHCIEIRRKEYASLLKTTMRGSTHEYLDQLFDNLHPYIEPDYELLEIFGTAARAGNTSELNQILGLSTAIWDARTCEAMNARSLLPSRSVPWLLSNSKEVSRSVTSKELALVESALAQNVRLDIPEDIDINAYLECVSPYREELASIADNLAAEVVNSEKNQLTRLNNKLGELHEQIAALSKHKGFLTYRAVWGFTRTNKALVASLILASAYGLAGNYLGCGVGILTAMGSPVVKKFKRIKTPREVSNLASEIDNSIRPRIHKLISQYLRIDVRAIQLFEISELLSSSLGKSRSKKSVVK